MREASGRDEEWGETGWRERERPEPDPPGFPFSIEEGPPAAERPEAPGGSDALREAAAPRPRRAAPESTDVPLILPGGRRASSRHERRETLLWAFAFLVATGALGWALIAPVSEDGASDPAEFRTATLPETEGAPWEAAAGFSDAAAAYGERARDFDLGRLDCAGLRRGFETAEEAFAELSGRLAAAGPEGPAGRAGEEARRAMREVERHFEASDCPTESTESPAP